MSILDAVQYWISQESLGEQWIKEREARARRDVREALESHLFEEPWVQLEAGEAKHEHD